MLRKPLLGLLLALVLFAGFAVGLFRLFMLRYEIGDVYPPYCSLRADPLGTKVLADALDELPGVEVRRNFKPLQRLRPSEPVTLVYAGVTHRAFWTEEELSAFDSIVGSGSRAIFTFLPLATPRTPGEERSAGEAEREKKKEKTASEKSGAKKKKKDTKTDGRKPGKDAPHDKKEKKDDDDEEMPETFVKFDTVTSRWGFAFDFLPVQKGKAWDRRATLARAGGNLESEIAWHSALHFKDIDPKWRVLYTCDDKPVVMERTYGAGSIMVMADSFLVSNEALSGKRLPQLLARLFMGPPLVIFDEEHNGVRDDPGIASLARKYRLHGVIAGLILLAALFVWKNATRFIPPLEDAGAGDVIAGKESGEGFVNLLRRAIRPSAIFETCVTEWRKVCSHKSHEVAIVEEAWAGEQIRPVRERDPVAAYRAISRGLARKK